MRLSINVLYNNGIEKLYYIKSIKDELIKEDFEIAIDYYKNELIYSAYKDGSKGYLNFVNEDNQDITINIQQTSEISFKVVE